MRDAIRLFRKFLPPYKTSIILNVVFNFLGAIFGIFSFFTMIPLLKILLRSDNVVYKMQHIDFSIIPLKIPKEAVMNNVYAFVQQVSAQHGALNTLIMISILFIIMVLFKTPAASP